MSTCLSLHSPLTSVSLPLLSDEEILSGEPQTPGLCLSSLRMCLNCENEKGGGGRGGRGGGVVVKVGEGGIQFPCRWNCFLSAELENISEKMCGRFRLRDVKPLC